MSQVLLVVDADEFDSTPSRDDVAWRGFVAVTTMVVPLVKRHLGHQGTFHFTGSRIQAEHRERFPVVHPRQAVNDEDVTLVVMSPHAALACPEHFSRFRRYA